MVDLLVEKLNYLTHKRTKKIQLSKNKRPLKKWISPSLVNSIRVRDKLHKKLIKQPNNIQLNNQYKTYRNILNNLIKQSKTDYFNKKFDEHKNNSKKTWQYINELLDTKKNTKSINIEAKVLNKYFAEVGETFARKISDDINNIPIPQSQTNPCDKSIFLSPTNATEIQKIIDQLKNKATPGADNFTGAFIKQISHFITSPLEFIFNKCLSSGYFPKKFKEAKIIPIPKSGDLSKPENYRPISLLSNLSKILEKILKLRLMSFLEKENIISDNQYGFQAKKSTNDAVIHLNKIIYDNFNENKKSLAVFMDLSKAFDTIPHNILLNKLDESGIRGSVNKLFSSYLSDRKQYLTLNGQTDIQSTSHFGLPQGSVLSPILFLIYVNDLLKLNLRNCTTLSFADDTTLVFSGNSWEELFNNANNSLKIVQKWLQDHILTLNTDKTKYITFSPNITGQPPISLDLRMNTNKTNTMNEEQEIKSLERVQTMKYLGILVDQHLKWNKHIEYLCSKLKYVIHIFYKIQKIKNLDIIRKVYYAYAHSLFQYVIEVWGAAFDTHLKKVFILQKHIIRAALGRPRLYSSREIFIELNVPTLRQTYIKRVIRYINKHRNQFKIHTTPYNIRANSTNTFNIHLIKLTICRHQLQYYCNYLINKIPLDFVNRNITGNLNRIIQEWIDRNIYFKLI